MDSQHIPPVVGTLGMITTLTIGEINEFIGILVGITTLVYLVVRIIKEIRTK